MQVKVKETFPVLLRTKTAGNSGPEGDVEEGKRGPEDAPGREKVERNKPVRNI